MCLCVCECLCVCLFVCVRSFAHMYMRLRASVCVVARACLRDCDFARACVFVVAWLAYVSVCVYICEHAFVYAVSCARVCI